MDVGSFPKRREREGMPVLSPHGRVHEVSHKPIRNPQRQDVFTRFQKRPSPRPFPKKSSPLS